MSGHRDRPRRFGAYLVLDAKTNAAPVSTRGPFDPSEIHAQRGVCVSPFAPGPFAIFHVRPGDDFSGWRVALRDSLRLPASPLRAQIVDANRDDDRVPYFFVTEETFGIPLADVVETLSGPNARCPDAIAHALSAGLCAHLHEAIVLRGAGLRPRPPRVDALIVNSSGMLIDTLRAPFGLAGGWASGNVDLDRVARAYGSLLARLPSRIAEDTAFALLQSAAAVTNERTRVTSEGLLALANFAQHHFRDAHLAFEEIREEHALLDETVVSRLQR